MEHANEQQEQYNEKPKGHFVRIAWWSWMTVVQTLKSYERSWTQPFEPSSPPRAKSAAKVMTAKPAPTPAPLKTDH
jgi:hypothetical protein